MHLIFPRTKLRLERKLVKKNYIRTWSPLLHFHVPGSRDADYLRNVRSMVHVEYIFVMYPARVTRLLVARTIHGTGSVHLCHVPGRVTPTTRGTIYGGQVLSRNSELSSNRSTNRWWIIWVYLCSQAVVCRGCDNYSERHRRRNRRSGSMGGEKKMKSIAREAAKTVVGTLNPNDRVRVTCRQGTCDL